MVSHATGIAPSALRSLIVRETHGRQLGFLASPYLDVLQLNEPWPGCTDNPVGYRPGISS